MGVTVEPYFSDISYRFDMLKSVFGLVHECCPCCSSRSILQPM